MAKQVESKQSKMDVSETINKMKPVEDPREYLTEEEKNKIKEVQQIQVNLQQKLIEYAETDLLIKDLNSKLESSISDIQKLQKELESKNKDLSIELLQKYGKFNITEDGEVIRQ